MNPKRRHRRRKLQYNLICPLTCKYCGRRYESPFTCFWDHIRNHELKYRRFWSKSALQTSKLKKVNAWRVIRRPTTVHTTSKAGNQSNAVIKETLNTTIKDSAIRENAHINTQSSKKNRSSKLHPKLCKYCRRRFFHRFWRYHRHLRNHERRYNKHWYSIVYGKKPRHLRSLKKKRKKKTSRVKKKDNRKLKKPSDSETCNIGDLLTQRILQPNSEALSDQDIPKNSQQNVSLVPKSIPKNIVKSLNFCPQINKVKPTKIPNEGSSRKYVEDKFKNHSLVVKLVRLKIEPAQLQKILPLTDLKLHLYGNDIGKTIGVKTHLKQNKKSAHSNNGDYSIDMSTKTNVVKKFQQSKKAVVEETTWETKYMEDLHFLDCRKRPEVGYYSRLDKGLDVACHPVNQTYRSEISKNITKHISIIQKSTQSTQKINNKMHSKPSKNDKLERTRKHEDKNKWQLNKDTPNTTVKDSTTDETVVILNSREIQETISCRRKRPQAGYYSKLYKGLHDVMGRTKRTSEVLEDVTLKDSNNNRKACQSSHILKGRFLKNKPEKDENGVENEKEDMKATDNIESDKSKNSVSIGKDNIIGSRKRPQVGYYAISSNFSKSKLQTDEDNDQGDEWEINSSEDSHNNSSDESYKVEESSDSEEDLSSADSTDNCIIKNENIVVKAERVSEDNQTADELYESQSSLNLVTKNKNNGGEDKTTVSANSNKPSIVNSNLNFDRFRKDFGEVPPPRHITNMKRLTQDQLLQLEKNRASKRYINNIPCFKTKRRKFGCKICGKYFAFEQYLKSHMGRHTTPKKYACKFCGKCFQWRFKLRDHTNIHTGKTPYRCRICGKGFTSSKNIKSHERFHTGEKPYKCTYCDKCFRLQSMLISHVRYHTGERPYACQTCGKPFHTAGHLSRHEKTHSVKLKHRSESTPQLPRPKLHSCEYCGKRFSNSSGVKAHRRTHTKEKPFPCSICGRPFAHKSHRGRHERTVHGGLRPYQCRYCGKRFAENTARKKHEIFVHAWDDASSDEKVSSDEEVTTNFNTPKLQPPTTPIFSEQIKDNRPVNRTKPSSPSAPASQPSQITDPSSKIMFTRKNSNKTTHQPVFPREYSSVQEGEDYNDNKLSNTLESMDNSIQQKQSMISNTKTTVNRDTTRSVFDKFVSKTKVNIVVKHTCGKQYRNKNTSPDRPNINSLKAADGDNETRSIFTRMKSSRRTKHESIGIREQNVSGDDDRASQEQFSSRNASRCSSESRDFHSTLSRLESIQRNAKLIADVLRRNKRGKNINSKQLQDSPPQIERGSSLASLMHNLDSSDSSTGNWAKTSLNMRHKTGYRRKSNLLSSQKPVHDIYVVSSSPDSCISDECPRTPITNTKNTHTHHDSSKDASIHGEKFPINDNANFKKRNKKRWHLSLTPEMQRRLGRQRRKKKFHCSYCDKKFLWRSNCRIHENEHTDGKQHICRFCKKGFGILSRLKRHEMIHTGEKKFKCRFCPKRFSEKYGLTCHERTHTGEKPFKCLKCGKCFIEAGRLTKHETTHSSERPYKCKYPKCDATFKSLGPCKRHERTTHGGVRYECVFCNTNYSRRENLYAHERVHHSGSKPYLCQECDQRFSDSEKYKKHKRKHNKN